MAKCPTTKMGRTKVGGSNKTRTQRRIQVIDTESAGTLVYLNMSYGNATSNWSSAGYPTLENTVYVNVGPTSGINFTGGTHELVDNAGNGTGITVVEQQGVDSGVGVAVPVGIDTSNGLYTLGNWTQIPGSFFAGTLRSNNTGATVMRHRFEGIPATATIRCRCIRIDSGAGSNGGMTIAIRNANGSVVDNTLDLIPYPVPGNVDGVAEVQDPTNWTDQTFAPTPGGVLELMYTPTATTQGLSCMLWEVFGL